MWTQRASELERELHALATALVNDLDLCVANERLELGTVATRYTDPGLVTFLDSTPEFDFALIARTFVAQFAVALWTILAAVTLLVVIDLLLVEFLSALLRCVGEGYPKPLV